ncbi:hypothetical protein AOLI_G00067920 [Acnodon oligacanthus]
MFFSPQLLLLLTLTIRADIIAGYFMCRTDECITSSPDLSDVEYIYTNYFNKETLVQFNSTVGEFVGFTEFGKKVAKGWNDSPFLQQLQGELDRYCKPNLQLDYAAILEKAVLPEVHLRSEQEAEAGRSAILMCSAYNFYPRDISIYWSTPTWSTNPNLERRSPVWWTTPAPWSPSSLTGIRPFLILKRARSLPVVQECCWGLSWQFLDSSTIRGKPQGSCRWQLKFWSLG